MTQTAIQQAIHQLFAGRSLSAEQAEAAMTEIMQGEATPAQVGAFLAALRMKGETVDEITGCARAMKRSAVQVQPAHRRRHAGGRRRHGRRQPGHL